LSEKEVHKAKKKKWKEISGNGGQTVDIMQAWPGEMDEYISLSNIKFRSVQKSEWQMELHICVSSRFVIGRQLVFC